MRHLFTKTVPVCLGIYAFICSAAMARPPLSPDAVAKADKDALVARLNVDATVHFKDPPEIHITLLQTKDAETLGRIRRACATHRMGAIIDAVAADGRKASQQGGRATPMPDVTSYCLAGVAEAQRRGAMADLYIDLALQEYGFDTLYFAKQAELLTSNEPGRTLEAVLRAANSGATNYATVANTQRDLSCPLALDAGAAFANANTTAKAPNITAAEARTVARQCYNPGASAIVIAGTKMPAQRAGLLAGIWFARNGF